MKPIAMATPSAPSSSVHARRHTSRDADTTRKCQTEGCQYVSHSFGAHCLQHQAAPWNVTLPPTASTSSGAPLRLSSAPTFPLNAVYVSATAPAAAPAATTHSIHSYSQPARWSEQNGVTEFNSPVVIMSEQPPSEDVLRKIHIKEYGRIIERLSKAWNAKQKRDDEEWEKMAKGKLADAKREEKDLLERVKRQQRQVENRRMNLLERENDPDVKQLETLDKSLKRLQAELRHLEMEIYLPHAQQWMFRFPLPEEQLFIGVRDITVDEFSGNLISTLQPGKMSMEIREAKLVVDVADLRICGPTRSAKFINKFVTPDRLKMEIQMDIKLTGNFIRPSATGSVRTSESTSESGHWEPDEDFKFEIKIAKVVEGAITAPDSLISWVCNRFLPDLFKDAIREWPIEVGEFASDPLCGQAYIEARFQSKACVPHTVWNADIAGGSEESQTARSLCGFTPEQAAVMKHVIEAGHITELPKPTLAVLYRYFSKFSVQETIWKELSTAWQTVLNDVFKKINEHRNSPPKKEKKSFFSSLRSASSSRLSPFKECPWFLAMIQKLNQLGRKPIITQIQLAKSTVSDLDLDRFLELYCKQAMRLERERIDAFNNQSRTSSTGLIAGQLPSELLRQLQENNEKLIQLKNWFTSILPLFACKSNFKLRGGSGVPFSMNVSDIHMECSLPVVQLALNSTQWQVLTPSVDVRTSYSPEGHMILELRLYESRELNRFFDYLIQMRGVHVDLFTAVAQTLSDATPVAVTAREQTDLLLQEHVDPPAQQPQAGTVQQPVTGSRTVNASSSQLTHPDFVTAKDMSHTNNTATAISTATVHTTSISTGSAGANIPSSSSAMFGPASIKHVSNAPPVYVAVDELTVDGSLLPFLSINKFFDCSSVPLSTSHSHHQHPSNYTPTAATSSNVSVGFQQRSDVHIHLPGSREDIHIKPVTDLALPYLTLPQHKLQLTMNTTMQIYRQRNIETGQDRHLLSLTSGQLDLQNPRMDLQIQYGLQDVLMELSQRELTASSLN